MPGLGRYTRNAVLSQAFDLRLPILEANSVRVLARLFGRTGDPRSGPEQRWLWAAAESLLPSRRVGDFNQALMELGALVCTPTAPRCGECPLAADCAARRLGLQAVIPARRLRRNRRCCARPPWSSVAANRCCCCNDRRTDAGRRCGNFRTVRLLKSEASDEAAARLLGELTGLQGRIGSELITFRHGVTRFRITLVCFEAEYLSGDFRSAFYRQAVWVTPAELSVYPVSSPQRRLAKVLADDNRQRRLF